MPEETKDKKQKGYLTAAISSGLGAAAGGAALYGGAKLPGYLEAKGEALEKKLPEVRRESLKTLGEVKPGRKEAIKQLEELTKQHEGTTKELEGLAEKIEKIKKGEGLANKIPGVKNVRKYITERKVKKLMKELGETEKQIGETSKTYKELTGQAKAAISEYRKTKRLGELVERAKPIAEYAGPVLKYGIAPLAVLGGVGYGVKKIVEANKANQHKEFPY